MRSSHSRTVARLGVTLLILASLGGASRPALAEFTFEVVKSFELLPWELSELVAGRDGALYGTSFPSGMQNGTIFRIDGTGALTILHVFDEHEEGYPNGPLTLESDGSLYGTTGNAYRAGTIYKIDSTGAFTALRGGCPDPFVPGSDSSLYRFCAGGLTVGSDGALYGTTRDFVFRLDDAGTEIPIYRFTEADGAGDWSALTLGSDGALYGTTESIQYYGQPLSLGSVFRIDSAGNFSTLHTFSGLDGSSPSALTLGSDGVLYGTTTHGGTTSVGGSAGYGTAFRIDSVGNFASLHSFDSSDALPDYGLSRVLTLGRDGAIYGVNALSVFRIDRTGAFTVVHSFLNSGLGVLRYPLVPGPDGALYGTTYGCAVGLCGYLDSVFKIDPDGSFSSLRSYSVPEEGSGPSAPLVVGRDGALYGTTVASGPANGGTVFRLDSAGAFKSLMSFPFRYYGPPVELVVGGDGILYGSLSVPAGGGCSSGEGGPSPGSIFEVDPGGNASVVHTFDCTAPSPGPLTVGADGAIWGTVGSESLESQGVFRIDSAGGVAFLYAGTQASSLTLGPDGALYGTNPGYPYYPDPDGAVFRVDNTLVPTVLHVFDGEDRAAEGYDPVGPLSLGSDGALYGATASGGSADLGTLFRIDAAGGFSSLHSFSGTDGVPPNARLVAGADGAMYGTTPRGGSSDLGTVFRVDAAGVFTLLHSFSGSDGANPEAALVRGSDGALYGPTRRGGSHDVGTIFRVDPSGAFESLHSFTGADGARPFTALVWGSDGALYGTAAERGPGGGGVVYRVHVAGDIDTDGDGEADAVDNCPTIPNADQRDTNHDGYGNLCDADFDGDGFVGMSDFAIFKSAFGTSIADPAYNPDVDMTGDGAIGIPDFGLFTRSFGRAVGQ